MRIEVLGPVRLVTDRGEPVEVPERQLRVLLASLVEAEGTPVTSEMLVDRLWDGNRPAKPKKVLQAKLSRLRSLLDQARPGARDLLTYTAAGYRLHIVDGTSDSTDVHVFASGVGRVRQLRPSPQKARELTELLGLWQAGPYGDVSDELWLAPSVTRLDHLRGEALEALISTHLDLGDPEEALRLAHGAVDTYPTHEKLAGAVMLALYQAGRQQEALELFVTLRGHLSEELGVDPDPSVRELHARILRQDPTLVSDGETARPPGGADGRSTLPAPSGRLIGRERDTATAESLVLGNRLVTLTGIGGVGKTRMAVHVAHNLAPQFERGAWFMDLTELSVTPDEQVVSGERVASLVAAELGLPRPSGMPERSVSTDTVARVCEALKSSSVLLVLDNCEHVVAEAALFTRTLLLSAPDAKVVATSREPLGLPDEQRFDVATLSNDLGEDGELSAAVEFFLCRAGASDPTFRVQEGSLPAVAELCRRLDGLPLALELAASRIRGLSVEDLLDRLSERLTILRRPGHAVPRRQQTLRGMIDWSWSLLTPAEQTVLRRLSVHPGTFGLKAAEGICADGPDGEHTTAPELSVKPGEVVDVLISLVDQSLVTTSATATGVRYGLLESIATYAGEKLDDAGERESVARRHGEYCLAFAREADVGLRGSGQRHWFPRVEAEHVQLRHAFDEAVRRDDGATATGLAVATFWYYWISGRHSDLFRLLPVSTTLGGPRDDTYWVATVFTEALNIRIADEDAGGPVDRALAMIDDDAARARAQWFAGVTLLATGFRSIGEGRVDEAIRVLLDTGNHWDAAIAASLRDWFIISQWGDPPRGLPGGYSPEAIIRESGDGYGLSQIYAVEYCVADIDGDHRRSVEAAERALEVCRELGLRAEADYWLTVTAIMDLRQGDVVGAEQRLAESRSLSGEFGDREGVYFADLGLAMVARQKGDYATARALLGRWLDFCSTDGLPPAELRRFNAHVESGFLAIQEGDTDLARDAVEVLYTPVRQKERGPSPARLLELSAAVHAARGDARTAAEVLGTAEALREESMLDPTLLEQQDIQRVRGQVAARLSAEEFAAGVDRGRTSDPFDQLESSHLRL